MATVLITGTNKGVGLEMTKIYAARLDTVIACCRNPDDAELPLHKAGAGTRSLATLAMLTLIVRRRGRGILALEEPETFLFPHAQRRIIDECIALSNHYAIRTGQKTTDLRGSKAPPLLPA